MSKSIQRTRCIRRRRVTIESIDIWRWSHQRTTQNRKLRDSERDGTRTTFITKDETLVAFTDKYTVVAGGTDTLNVTGDVKIVVSGSASIDVAKAEIQEQSPQSLLILSVPEINLVLDRTKNLNHHR